MMNSHILLIFRIKYHVFFFSDYNLFATSQWQNRDSRLSLPVQPAFSSQSVDDTTPNMKTKEYEDQITEYQKRIAGYE